MPFFGRTHFGFIALSGLVIVCVLIAVARFTRADRTQLRWALIGGAGAALANVGIDWIAHLAGWWRYPELTTPFGTLGYCSASTARSATTASRSERA